MAPNSQVCHIRRERPFHVIYNYHAVPLPPHSVATLFQYISSRIGQLSRLTMCLDHSRLPSDLLQSLTFNCLTHFLPPDNYDHSFSSFIWQQIRQLLPESGTLVLISDSNPELSNLVLLLQSVGWKCVHVHVPGIAPLEEAMTLELPVRQEERRRLYERRRLFLFQEMLPALGEKKKGQEMPRVRWRKDTVNRDKMSQYTKKTCPKWNNKVHTTFEPECPLFHPPKFCAYYPRCRWSADICTFAHGFCSSGTSCRCHPTLRDPQLNHCHDGRDVSR